MATSELVLQILFQQESLKPHLCPNVARACKSFQKLTDTFRKDHPYESFQNLVQKFGYFMSSVSEFQFAMEHGYVVYDLSIYYLVRHRAPTDVLEFAIRTNQNRVPACAVVEAWTQDRHDLFTFLYKRTTVELRAQVDAWVLDLQRRHKKCIHI